MKTKKMLAIWAIVFGLVGSASADLVAHYDFDGNANDSSGFGLHGIRADGATIFLDTDRGSVLRLDGLGGYVDCGNDPLFDITSSITVACWIKFDAQSRSSQAIVTKGNTTWRLQRNGSQHSVEFACTGVDVVGTSSSTIDGVTDVSDGQWHHVASVYDGNRMYLYVDGVLDNSKDATGLIDTNTYPVLIGENAERNQRWWDGLVDDVRIYDNALSAAEITVLAGAGNQAQADHLAPIAFAFIGRDGVVVSGTPNVSCAFNSDLWMYEITIADEHYFYTDYVTIVTISGGPSLGLTPWTASREGKLRVCIESYDNYRWKKDFQFVTYKSPPSVQ